MQTFGKVILFLFFLLCSVGTEAEPQLQPFVQKDASGLYFRCDPNTMTAALLPTQEKNAKKYRMENIVVPATITVEQGTISTGGTSQGEMVFTVTELEDNALKGATAYSITFAEPSSIVTLGERALYDVWVSGTLTLPSSLKLIKKEAVYVVVGKEAADYISKLVLPASLDSLCVSAIVLDRLQELCFMGTTPPRCEVLREGVGAYNPWTAVEACTSPDVKVTYPEGAYEAYNDCFGIGDYFNSFEGPQDTETPTAVEQTHVSDEQTSSVSARKVMQGGRVVIIRGTRSYNLFGQGL